jgi:hypothetical protein
MVQVTEIPPSGRARLHSPEGMEFLTERDDVLGKVRRRDVRAVPGCLFRSASNDG